MRSLALVVAFAACTAHSGAPNDGSGDDGPQCQTQPMLITMHPYAVLQPTTTGQDLADTRGFAGRLYFGYGDLGANTGPIEVTGYDPVANQWIDNFNYQTEQIRRFDPIEDQLWAPSGQPFGAFGDDYAVGTATNDWGSGGIPMGRALHVIEAVERAPGDIYLTGEDLFGSDSSTITSAAIWRSQNGGPFTEIFPEYNADPTIQNNQLNSWFFNAAALNGTLYVNYGWAFDGTSLVPPGADLGEFQHPTTFAGNIVSSTLGQLWAFDGTAMHDLDFTLFVGTGIELTTGQPLPIFQQTEGHLLALDVAGRVMATTDLATWSCVGQAPADVRSIGSLNGTIYFGGAGGRIYGFPAPSW